MYIAVIFQTAVYLCIWKYKNSPPQQEGKIIERSKKMSKTRKDGDGTFRKKPNGSIE